MKLIEMTAALLRQHEGLQLRMYLDTEDNLTIGYGHNLQSTPISEVAANVILYGDIANALQLCTMVMPRFYEMSTVRQAVIIDMMYNLGPHTFSKFVLFKGALSSRAWSRAAAEMEDSKWFTQCGNRVSHLAEMMRSNEYLIQADESSDILDLPDLDNNGAVGESEPEDPDAYMT